MVVVEVVVKNNVNKKEIIITTQLNKIAMVREAYSKPKYVNEFCREG
jgi:hypothetical protein